VADFFKKLEKTIVKVCNRVVGRNIDYTLFDDDEPLSIKGVFSNKYIEMLGIMSLHPVLRVNGDDIPRKPSVKDTVTIDTVVYKVSEARPDGFGGYDLILLKA
jgi:hypothetical protein